ncbi:unnamed protein product [Rotaria magnacalcarata]|uniref:Transmembrane protein n=1 Tax=Rotaria magnacalcarata TaxID=392030 RepID=A0A814Y882_9BILA|nr:unnamed protein product [Rotaria magnacalcarata]CAF1665098.1 unnamed protein product [Rotaria magnacalcarata]CAF2051914.1 unnamed protein product [Rotaria magnacalcarata]CAF4096488.1 unnamed protein product [Rotaria magnacalcarata]CAF4496071.1 unnamed protein product [Rotaria magnacalcarata]
MPMRRYQVEPTSPPNYSDVLPNLPPPYWTVVGTVIDNDQQPIPSPPPYADPIVSPPPYVAPIVSPPPVSLPRPIVQSSPASSMDKNRLFYSWSGLIWLVLLIILDVIHFVLFGVCFQCPLPDDDLSLARVFLFINGSFFTVGLIYLIYLLIKAKGLHIASGIYLGLGYSFCPCLVTLVCLIFTITTLARLNTAIQSFASSPNAYTCPLFFYQFLFGIIIFDNLLVLTPLITVGAIVCMACSK